MLKQLRKIIQMYENWLFHAVSCFKFQTFWNKIGHYLQDSQWVGALQFSHTVDYRTSITVCHPLLSGSYDGGYFEAILNNSHPFFFISCFDLTKQRRKCHPWLQLQCERTIFPPYGKKHLSVKGLRDLKKF